MKKLLSLFTVSMLVLSVSVGGIADAATYGKNDSAFQNLKDSENPSKQKDEVGTLLNGTWKQNTDESKFIWELSWEKVVFSKGYRVYRSLDNQDDFELMAEITDKKKVFWIDDNIDFSKKYFYKVSYIHGNNESADSNILEIDYEKDTDQDGLPDLIELDIKSDPLNKDSDGDSLEDSFEYNDSKTSLTKKDSDANGVTDDQEDLDKDDLTNLEEQQLSTFPFMDDSDQDGFLDGEEVHVYHTNPLNPDTDEDKLTDGMEPVFGTDPLNPNTKSQDLLDGELQVEHVTETELTERDQKVNPTVTIKTTAENATSLVITNVEDMFANLSNDLPGYLGAPFDFETNEDFNEATLTFKYDQSLEDVTSNFRPEIYYYNEETEQLEKLANQDFDREKNTVSAQVKHFSTYILLNGVLFDEAWEREMRIPNTDEEGNVKNIDVVFSIDSSGSMSSNDRDSLRKEAASRFVDRLREEDRSAVVDFDNTARTLVELTSDKTKVKYAISRIDSSGGTNLYRGLQKAVDEIVKNGNEDHGKYIIFLTDGDGSWNESALNSAKDHNIIVYTIGLGYGVNQSLLKRIATETGGKYFFATDASNLGDIFDETAEDTIDDAKDSDLDGISDFNELNGYRIENTIWIKTDPNKDDTDGDGLKDGEEVILSSLNMNSGTFYNTISRPDKYDTDKDGISDGNDKRPKEYDVSKTNLVLMSEIAYVNLESFEGQDITDLREQLKESVNKRLNALDGWKIANAEDSNFYDSGMSAIALKKGKQMVIAYRGTEFNAGGLNDILSDLQMTMLNSNHQINNAKRFAATSILDNTTTTNISITGHSLGGYLAQKISYDIIENELSSDLMMFPWNIYKLNKKLDTDYYKQSVTFGSPGFGGLGIGPISIFDLLSDKYDNKVVNYRIDGDHLSELYAKLGLEINLENLKVSEITGDVDDEGILGPHSLSEYYSHFIDQ